MTISQVTPAVLLLGGVLAAAPEAGRRPPVEASKPARPLAVGDPAPEAVAYDGAGDAVALPREYRGRAMLLTFWTAKDAAGRRHVDRLVEVCKRFPDRETIVVLAVQIARDGDEWELRQDFLEAKGRTDYGDPRRFWGSAAGWQMYETPDRAVTAAYGVTAVPTSFVIGPDGRLLAVHVPDEEILPTLEKLLDAPVP